MEDTSQPKFHTYYFIESHLSSIDNNIEITLETKHPGVQPLKKVLQKTLISADGEQDYLITVYSGDIIPSLIKDKDIKTIQSNLRTFPLKLILKEDKNIFETKINSCVDIDCFINMIKFESIKKLVGKPIDPPEQFELSPFDYITLFSEAILTDSKNQSFASIYIEFLKFSIDVIRELQIIPFKLFLFLYEKIVFSQNIELLYSILDIFEIDKMEYPKTYEEVIMYRDSLIMIYNDQMTYVGFIQMIPNVDLLLFLIKFYNIFIFYYFQINEIKTIENILLDLRDRNPYDTLILARMFLSHYNNFYRSLQINHEIKMSLIDSYFQASFTYDNLITSFSMISEYVQGDLNKILMIIIQNYDKINQICLENNTSLKINDFIAQKYEDDLENIQKNLITLGQNKLNKGYNAIVFDNNMWDIYFTDEKNSDFFEFLKSHLIQTSLYLAEIIEALCYIIKYTKKNMNSMLELFSKNYDRLETICINEKKFINAADFLEPKESDNIDDIKIKLDTIISNKMKSNYPTIYFKIDIWIFYIINDFKEEFQLYLEKKLFESALTYEDICDCLTYGTTQKKRKFSSFIKLIIQNLDKIHSKVEPRKKCIEIMKYIEIREKEDNIQELYDYISELVRIEKIKNYKIVNFPIKIWESYSMSQDLEYLRTIKNIINKLSEIDETLNENDINLIQKLHNVGFMYIKEGKLSGEKLLEFLGKEEAAYVKNRVNNIIESKGNRQVQLTEQWNKICNLLEKQRIATNKNINYQKEIARLKNINNDLRESIKYLEKNSADLFRRCTECENEISKLRSRATF